MMSLRARIFIVISLVVLFVLGVSIFLFVRSKNKNDGQPNNTNNGSNTGLNPIATEPLVVANLNNVQVPKISSTEAQQKAVQNLAKIFAERINSYSSESRYQNMFDVRGLSTDAYWQQLQARIPANIPNASANFYAISTDAYSANLSAWTEKTATVDLQMKITEEKGGVISKKDAQAKVNLVKVGDNWLVENFTIAQ